MYPYNLNDISVQSGNGFNIKLSAGPEPSITAECMDHIEILFEYDLISIIRCGGVKKSTVINK